MTASVRSLAALVALTAPALRSSAGEPPNERRTLAERFHPQSG